MLSWHASRRLKGRLPSSYPCQWTDEIISGANGFKVCDVCVELSWRAPWPWKVAQPDQPRQIVGSEFPEVYTRKVENSFYNACVRLDLKQNVHNVPPRDLACSPKVGSVEMHVRNHRASYAAMFPVP